VNPVLADARRGHPGLFWFAAVMAALALVCVGLAVVDQRTLLGAPLWFKPLKFSISLTFYCATMAWMLSRLPAGVMRWAGWVLVVTAGVEMVAVVGQAARGVRSHFNDDSGSDELIFAVMGATIVVFFLASAAVAVRFLAERHLERTTLTAVRLGLLVALLGMGVGVIMGENGAHAVGVPDGGPGLPLVGWSTTGGDLRIGHFVGLHALQLLPLLAAVLTARAWHDVRARRQAVVIAGAGYAGLVVLLTWQALRAQPLLAPDAATLAALVALVAGTGGALLLVRRAATRRLATPAAPVLTPAV
jgi:hypothetical protein